MRFMFRYAHWLQNSRCYQGLTVELIRPAFPPGMAIWFRDSSGSYSPIKFWSSPRAPLSVEKEQEQKRPETRAETLFAVGVNKQATPGQRKFLRGSLALADGFLIIALSIPCGGEMASL